MSLRAELASARTGMYLIGGAPGQDSHDEEALDAACYHIHGMMTRWAATMAKAAGQSIPLHLCLTGTAAHVPEALYYYNAFSPSPYGIYTLSDTALDKDTDPTRFLDHIAPFEGARLIIAAPHISPDYIDAIASNWLWGVSFLSWHDDSSFSTIFAT